MVNKKGLKRKIKWRTLSIGETKAGENSRGDSFSSSSTSSAASSSSPAAVVAARAAAANGIIDKEKRLNNNNHSTNGDTAHSTYHHQNHHHHQQYHHHHHQSSTNSSSSISSAFVKNGTISYSATSSAGGNDEQQQNNSSDVNKISSYHHHHTNYHHQHQQQQQQRLNYRYKSGNNNYNNYNRHHHVSQYHRNQQQQQNGETNCNGTTTDGDDSTNNNINNTNNNNHTTAFNNGGYLNKRRPFSLQNGTSSASSSRYYKNNATSSIGNGKISTNNCWKSSSYNGGSGGGQTNGTTVTTNATSKIDNKENSDTKPLFNEDDYTRITTPRQDVLFKKGYLSRPKKYAITTTATTNTTEPSSSSSGSSGQTSILSPEESMSSSIQSSLFNTSETSGIGGGDGSGVTTGDDTTINDLFDPLMVPYFYDQNGVFFINPLMSNGFDAYGNQLMMLPYGTSPYSINPTEYYNDNTTVADDDEDNNKEEDMVQPYPVTITTETAADELENTLVDTLAAVPAENGCAEDDTVKTNHLNDDKNDNDNNDEKQRTDKELSKSQDCDLIDVKSSIEENITAISSPPTVSTSEGVITKEQNELTQQKEDEEEENKEQSGLSNKKSQGTDSDDEICNENNSKVDNVSADTSEINDMESIDQSPQPPPPTSQPQYCPFFFYPYMFGPPPSSESFMANGELVIGGQQHNHNHHHPYGRFNRFRKQKRRPWKGNNSTGVSTTTTTASEDDEVLDDDNNEIYPLSHTQLHPEAFTFVPGLPFAQFNDVISHTTLNTNVSEFIPQHLQPSSIITETNSFPNPITTSTSTTTTTKLNVEVPEFHPRNYNPDSSIKNQISDNEKIVTPNEKQSLGTKKSFEIDNKNEIIKLNDLNNEITHNENLVNAVGTIQQTPTQTTAILKTKSSTSKKYENINHINNYTNNNNNNVTNNTNSFKVKNDANNLAAIVRRNNSVAATANILNEKSDLVSKAANNSTVVNGVIRQQHHSNQKRNINNHKNIENGKKINSFIPNNNSVAAVSTTMVLATSPTSPPTAVTKKSSMNWITVTKNSAGEKLAESAQQQQLQQPQVKNITCPINNKSIKKPKPSKRTVTNNVKNEKTSQNQLPTYAQMVGPIITVQSDVNASLDKEKTDGNNEKISTNEIPAAVPSSSTSTVVMPTWTTIRTKGKKKYLIIESNDFWEEKEPESNAEISQISPLPLSVSPSSKSPLKLLDIVDLNDEKSSKEILENITETVDTTIGHTDKEVAEEIIESIPLDASTFKVNKTAKSMKSMKKNKSKKNVKKSSINTDDNPIESLPQPLTVSSSPLPPLSPPPPKVTTNHIQSANSESIITTTTTKKDITTDDDLDLSEFNYDSLESSIFVNAIRPSAIYTDISADKTLLNSLSLNGSYSSKSKFHFNGNYSKMAGNHNILREEEEMVMRVMKSLNSNTEQSRSPSLSPEPSSAAAPENGITEIDDNKQVKDNEDIKIDEISINEQIVDNCDHMITLPDDVITANEAQSSLSPDPSAADPENGITEIDDDNQVKNNDDDDDKDVKINEIINNEKNVDNCDHMATLPDDVLTVNDISKDNGDVIESSIENFVIQNDETFRGDLDESDTIEIISQPLEMNTIKAVEEEEQEEAIKEVIDKIECQLNNEITEKEITYSSINNKWVPEINQEIDVIANILEENIGVPKETVTFLEENSTNGTCCELKRNDQCLNETTNEYGEVTEEFINSDSIDLIVQVQNEDNVTEKLANEINDESTLTTISTVDDNEMDQYIDDVMIASDDEELFPPESTMKPNEMNNNNDEDVDDDMIIDEMNDDEIEELIKQAEKIVMMANNANLEWLPVDNDDDGDDEDDRHRNTKTTDSDRIESPRNSEDSGILENHDDITTTASSSSPESLAGEVARIKFPLTEAVSKWLTEKHKETTPEPLLRFPQDPILSEKLEKSIQHHHIAEMLKGYADDDDDDDEDDDDNEDEEDDEDADDDDEDDDDDEGALDENNCSNKIDKINIDGEKTTLINNEKTLSKNLKSNPLHVASVKEYKQSACLRVAAGTNNNVSDTIMTSSASSPQQIVHDEPDILEYWENDPMLLNPNNNNNNHNKRINYSKLLARVQTKTTDDILLSNSSATSIINKQKTNNNNKKKSNKCCIM